MHTAYKALVLILLLTVIFELFHALYFMIKDRGQSRRTVWALTRRMALWVILVGVIAFGLWMGWLGHPGPI